MKLVIYKQDINAKNTYLWENALKRRGWSGGEPEVGHISPVPRRASLTLDRRARRRLLTAGQLFSSAEESQQGLRARTPRGVSALPRAAVEETALRLDGGGAEAHTGPTE